MSLEVKMAAPRNSLLVGTLSSMLRTAKAWRYVVQGVDFSNLTLPQRSKTQRAACFTAQQVHDASECFAG